MTEAIYRKLRREQNGRCFICQRRPKRIGDRRGLATDHDHKTGEVRGLLCAGCNMLAGWLERYGKRVRAYHGGGLFLVIR